jgi:hypothetical protein
MVEGETLPEMNRELIVRGEESRDPNRSQHSKDNGAGHPVSVSSRIYG